MLLQMLFFEFRAAILLCAVRNAQYKHQRITVRNEKETGHNKLSKRLLGPLLGTGKKWPIRHFHISHNAPYFAPPPPPPAKFCVISLFHFPWVLQPSQEKLKTILMENLGGQTRCIMGNVEVANT